MTMNEPLVGKVALVTGSGRGIGKAIAARLADAGARIVLNDLDGDVAAKTADEFRKNGHEVALCSGDVTAEGFAAQLVDAALKQFGTIDIIVNNAGYAWDSVLQQTTDEQWEAMLNVHLTAPFRILRAAQPHIAASAKREIELDGRAKRRTIVNISSVAGLGGNAGQVGYTTGKAGIIGITKTLAKEMGRYNVTVNALAFGAITTRMTVGEVGSSTIKVGKMNIPAGVSEELLESMKRNIPLGRTGTPEEAAGPVYLLCLPEANYISGQVITVGGGWSI